jgi:hypothetical protein
MIRQQGGLFKAAVLLPSIVIRNRMALFAVLIRGKTARREETRQRYRAANLFKESRTTRLISSRKSSYSSWP